MNTACQHMAPRCCLSAVIRCSFWAFFVSSFVIAVNCFPHSIIENASVCWIFTRVVCTFILNQCCCPWGGPRPQEPTTRLCNYLPRTTSLCPWITNSSKTVETSFSCMNMWKVNLVTATVHEVTVKNGLLTDIKYYLLYQYVISKISESKPLFTVNQCCCPQRKSLSSRTNFCLCSCPLTFESLSMNLDNNTNLNWLLL